MYKYKYKWKLKTHPLQGSQQTGTARLVGWRINPVAGGTITSYCPAQVPLYLYLLLCFHVYCVCIWISVFVIVFVFVFCQEQLPFVKNYFSWHNILTTTSWHNNGPQILIFWQYTSSNYSNNEPNILVGRISERGTGGERGVSGPGLRSIGQNLQVEKCCC